MENEQVRILSHRLRGVAYWDCGTVLGSSRVACSHLVVRLVKSGNHGGTRLELALEGMAWVSTKDGGT
jgi:hypothetical protein